MLSILVIEDVLQIRMTLSNTLVKQGYTVAVAASSAEGVSLYANAALQNQPFNLVLLDFNLPDKDGLTTLSALQAINSTVPVVLMSGGGGFAPLTDYAHYGFCGVLVKPFRVQELLAVVAASATVKAKL